jgi:hypothetical protein
MLCVRFNWLIKGELMAFKPNYNQARAERFRAKTEKKAEKLKQQQERTAQRQAEREGPTGEEPSEDRGDEPSQ